MKAYEGKEIYKEEANVLLTQACHDGNLAKVVIAVESMGADVNAMDAAGYARALIYALRTCSPSSEVGETIVKYLINRGAEVDFKHGDKYSNRESRPYFVYWAATNKFASDDLVYFIASHGSKESLTYKPTTQVGADMYTESALDVIKKSRPKVYNKLREKNLIDTSRR